MSHCHDEHEGHGHDHHDHGHGGHDHSNDITPALQKSLYDRIDFSRIVTLNEDEEGSGRGIVKKTWAERLEAEPELASSADEQILITIPFTGQASIHNILIRTSATDSAPKTMKVFVNRDDLDFSTASELSPVQTIELSQTSEIQDIQVKRQFYNTTQTITLFFEDNFGEGEEDVTRISYLGFKGTFMQLNKEGVSVLYEAAANPADHKAIVGTEHGVGHQIG